MDFVEKNYNTNANDFLETKKEIDERIQLFKSKEISYTKGITIYAEKFPPEVLLLSRFGFFYKGKDLYRKTVSDLIEINGEQLN